MADRISQEVVEILLDDTPNSRISQAVVEAMVCAPTAPNVRITQIVVEIILCTSPTLVCPISNIGTVGVPYSGMLLASGGHPPYTFEIIA